MKSFRSSVVDGFFYIYSPYSASPTVIQAYCVMNTLYHTPHSLGGDGGSMAAVWAKNIKI